MMRALFVQGLRRLGSAPIRMTVILLLMAGPSIGQALEAGSEPAAGDIYLALIVCAGLVGSDFSRGEVRLILARPVSRARYLLARWLSAGTALGALLLVQYLLGCVAAAMLGLDGAPSWQRIMMTGCSLATWGLLFAAMLLPISVSLPGETDACLYGFVGLGLLVMREFVDEPTSARVVAELVRLLFPKPDWLHYSPHYAFAVLSNSAIALLLACVILTRRELPSAPPA